MKRDAITGRWLREDPKQRLMRRVSKQTNGCWNWTGRTNIGGYGWIRLNGQVIAHRAAFSLFVSEIPRGKYVLHHCDNRRCVNPDHLFLGDAKSNMLDAKAKGRTWKPKGSLHPMAKLNEASVRAIRALSADGKTQSEIARLFGLVPSTISVVVSRKHWSHVR